MPLDDFTKYFDETYLGADFDLFDRGYGGELQFDETAKDVKLVVGLENLKKSIIRRLSTPLGELSVFVHDITGIYEVNSNYGSSAYNYLSEPISAYTLNQMQNAIKQCLEQETRIQVEDISYFIQPESSGKIIVYYSITYNLTENPSVSDVITITQTDGSFSFV